MFGETNSMKSKQIVIDTHYSQRRMPSINNINVLTLHPSLNPFLNEISGFGADV